MTLVARVHAAMTDAVRSQDALRRDTLRMAWNALYNAEKAARHPLSDDEAMAVLAREVKTRRESVEAYQKGGRADLVQREQAEIGIISGFLPEALTEAELRSMVEAAVDATGASGPRDLGRVMAVLAPRTRGRADGRLVSGLVAEELARRQAARSEAPAS